MNEITNPNFKDKEFLIGHIKSIMGFYHPHCIDNETGGFFQHFKDDGSIYDFDTRHLVSSTRFIFNYSMASIHFDNDEYIEAARHGIDYLRDSHLNKNTGGYAWTINAGGGLFSSAEDYGKFLLCMLNKGKYQNGQLIKEETFDLMENHFWSKDHELYSDEISSDWSIVTNYRGQNANMHTCEALIQAFESTNEQKYLDRALLIAKNICIRQAGLADGLIWEHYDTNWQINWSYNKDTPDDLFRPWGFQVGHLTEWAKLLIILERHADEDWLVSRAQELFDDAIEMGWDEKSEGLVYGFAPNGDVCDNDKYFWVQAESLAAAAVLANRTGDDYYWEFNIIWEFSWNTLIVLNMGLGLEF